MKTETVFRFTDCFQNYFGLHGLHGRILLPLRCAMMLAGASLGHVRLYQSRGGLGGLNSRLVIFD